MRVFVCICKSVTNIKKTLHIFIRILEVGFKEIRRETNLTNIMWKNKSGWHIFWSFFWPDDLRNYFIVAEYIIPMHAYMMNYWFLQVLTTSAPNSTAAFRMAPDFTTTTATTTAAATAATTAGTHVLHAHAQKSFAWFNGGRPKMN